MADELREVFRDRWLLIVDKPAGLPTQQTRGGEPGAWELLRRTHAYVGLHHRLDRPASGLLLFTLHRHANRGIAAALRERTLGRTYRAVLQGDAASTTWSTPVDGKSARTQVTRVGGAAGTTAVELSLHTGRKHQIRIQAAMTGTPVLGDRRYGDETASAWPRLALHAWRLTLTHPVTGESLALESDLPDDLASLWRRAGGH